MRQFVLVAALASSVFSLSFLERAQGYLSGAASANASVSAGANGGASSNNWLAGIQNSSFGQAVAGGIDYYNNAKNGNSSNNWQQQIANSSFGTWVQNGVDFYNNAKNGSGSVFNATAIQQQIGNSSFGETFQAGVEFFNNMKNGNGYNGGQSDILSMFIPFLSNASAEAQTEFNAIAAKLPTMTISEYEEAVNAWAAKYGLTAEVDAFNQRALNASASAEENANRIVMSLPNVINNIKAIGNDKNQTIAQMHARVVAYLETLDDETQEIVMVLFKSMLPPGFLPKKCNGGGNFMTNMYNSAVEFFSGNKNGKSSGNSFSFWGGTNGNGNGQVHPKIGMISNFLAKNNISEDDVNSAMDDTAAIQILPVSANVKLGGDFNTQVVDVVEEEVPKKNKKQQQQQQKKKNQNKKKTTVAPVADSDLAVEVHTQVL